MYKMTNTSVLMRVGHAFAVKLFWLILDSRASKIVQQVKLLGAKTDDQSSKPKEIQDQPRNLSQR